VGARGTCAVHVGAHSSDGQSDISELLLLSPTIMTGPMTSEDRCYYGLRGTRAVADSVHSSDGPSTATNSLISIDRNYYHQQWRRAV
jgi:hypothetical protein